MGAGRSKNRECGGLKYDFRKLSWRDTQHHGPFRYPDMILDLIRESTLLALTVVLSCVEPKDDDSYGALE